MNTIEKLKNQLPVNQILITDPKQIEYYTDHLYHVDERFIGLIVRKDQDPILLLNALFTPPETIDTILFNDGDDITSIILSHLTDDHLGVDGNAKIHFILPLMNKGIQITDLSDTLNYVRAIKDRDEIEKMKTASKSNDAIMASLVDQIQLGMTELELTEIAIKLQSESPQTGVSFDPIIVFTENAADPHAIASNRKLEMGDSILIDMGGMLEGYASDMTRVYFTDANSKLKEIYDVVLQANEAAIAAISIGQPFSSIDKAARDVITTAGYGQYFTHRTGHGIGRETHEPLDVSATNNTLIEAGMCFSIEPGIYIKDFGGIRIEDLICVTEDEVIVLNAAPKSYEDVILSVDKYESRD